MQNDFDAQIMNRAEIDYGNLEASRAEKTITTNFLRKVKQRSPARAKISLALTRQNEFISSTIVIQSVNGTFDSSMVGENIEESLELLYQDIISKLNAWKKERFQPLAANGY